MSDRRVPTAAYHGLRWLVGVVAATAIIAVTSPCFVRSYLPRPYDTDRNVRVLQPGSNYRWRSEGYASTTIGPHGMPGLSELPDDDPASIRLAFWGDSQAEGVCVADHQKVASVVAEVSGQDIALLPLARSGDNANDWICQIAGIEATLGPAAHVFLVVELSDWAVPVETVATESATSRAADEWENQIAAWCPAFVIHASRNLVTDAETGGLRTLRFRPRWGQPAPAAASPIQEQEPPVAPYAAQLDRLRSVTDRPCLFLYAPKFPSIARGRIVQKDSDAKAFDAFERLARERGYAVVDLRDSMRRSVQSGRWPRGFHNGQFGVGHYNATGNQLIARAIADTFATGVVGH
ncbi:hypothetical protein FYK55_03855 [Roseiconus nitratireducens]|uniref:SGNH/GDSL hydrolase family protein n=1 Tax=Roseiconus nitratireducens TaxID=2605748 RepID=A0A5M6DET3_9BACT|nr:hypothetical protein [Roseiconus nitratireducens]KAA5546047.1 hypothetical protein FYK55_03855 [Roseiconus nitratireducens]